MGIAEDIVVYDRGGTRTSHGMLIRFRSSGRKLNPADKCKFKQREIKFYRIICIEDGVKPHPDKVSALLRLCPPPHQFTAGAANIFFIPSWLHSFAGLMP